MIIAVRPVRNRGFRLRISSKHRSGYQNSRFAVGVIIWCEGVEPLGFCLAGVDRSLVVQDIYQNKRVIWVAERFLLINTYSMDSASHKQLLMARPVTHMARPRMYFGTFVIILALSKPKRLFVDYEHALNILG